MKLTATIKKLLQRKIATAVLVTASVAAFATLGDGGKKGFSANSATEVHAKSFSLRTNYNYRANHMFASRPSSKFIMLNTVVTYQKGNATYSLPLKRKVLLDKIKFNP